MTTQEQIDILKDYIIQVEKFYDDYLDSNEYNNAKQWLAELEKENKPIIKPKVDFDYLENKDRQSRF